MRLKRKSRVRKLTLKQRNLICELYKSGEWTMKELSEQFDVKLNKAASLFREEPKEFIPGFLAIPGELGLPGFPEYDEVKEQTDKLFNKN